MKVSIIVPAFNEEKLIAESLRHMNGARAVFSRRGWSSELIVCDNNSTDRTAERARAAGAAVVFEPVNQIGRARNTGAAAATGDWLIFIDADSFPSPELLADTAEAMADGRWLAGGCTMRLQPPVHWFWRCWAGQWNLISRAMKWAAGSFVFCETHAFRQAGGFDTRLYAGEEIDLCGRLNALAKRQDRGLIILRKHPLITSARKTTLYTRKELLTFLCRSITHPWRFVTTRSQCSLWYDGRR